MIARRINQFLSQIIQSIQPMVAGKMTMGQRMQRTPLPSILETNELAIAFNQMDEQLRNSFVALSEKEERFRTLIDNIPGIIYRCQNDEHWTMEFISDSVNDLLGYPAADFINNQVRSFASIIDPGDRQYVREATQLAISNQQPYRIEYRLVHHDGKPRWVIERGKGTFDAHGNLLHLDGAIFDVTEQRQARKALQEKEEMIHAIINAIPDLLIRTRIDGVELDILGNTSFSVEHPFFEGNDSTTQTKHVNEYLPPDLAQQRIDMILTAIAANQLQRYEQHLQGANNNSRYEEVRVSPINSNEALVIIRDITETKNIEEAMQELSVANRIQANMLPDYHRLCERIPQIDLAATMIPAKDVGGDFFDVFALDHRYLCIAIGDVSGKGMPAALFMVRAMTLLRMAVDTGVPLDRSAARVNQLLCMNNLECMFVTLFVGLLDVYTGKLQYVNCGHNPALLCRKGKAFEMLDSPRGILMGFAEEVKYEVATLVLQEDDVLVLYTDGVTEAESASHDYFSIERTVDVLNAVGDRTNIQSLLDTLQSSVNEFAQDMPQSDDITLLALRYVGGTEMKPEDYEEIELEWLARKVRMR